MSLRLLFLYSDPFGERLINNLINLSTWCQVCADTCTKCRSVYQSHIGAILDVYELPRSLPPFVEEPEKYFPINLPKVDVIICVGLHHDLLASIMHVVDSTEAKAVIVPIENPQWVPMGLRQQVSENLKKNGIECI
ncbi:MAG: DUF166 family protein, partial [Candidatus Hodarchaeota archaeon]